MLRIQGRAIAWVVAIAAVLGEEVAQTPVLQAQRQVSFPTQDGWTIYADLYRTADRGVVLVHGGRFTKESWEKQAQELAKGGFRVLAIDLRGYGMSKDGPPSLNPGFGSPLDALATWALLAASVVAGAAVRRASLARTP